MSTPQKQKAIQHLFSALGKRQKAEPTSLPVLEQFLYAILREGTTREAAGQAFGILQEQFFDWNEMRVSLTRELADVLIGVVPDAEMRAQRIIDFLQEVFETTFSFDLEPIVKKGQKQAAKQLSRFKAASDYTVACVVLHSLGGHAIPLDGPAVRCLRRLYILEDGKEDTETMRTSLEHLIPKAKGMLFGDLVSIVADEFCHEVDPDCPRCPMASVCPTAQEFKARPVAAAGKKAR